MHPREVDFLRRLIAEQAERRTAGPTALNLAQHEGIGRVRGASVVYSGADHLKAENLLKSRGFVVDRVDSGFKRSEAPTGGSEKTGAQRVSENLLACVMVKVPGFNHPKGSFLALDITDALQVPYEVLLICENLEPLLQLHTYRWLEQYFRGRAVMAVFRGAPGYFRTDVAAELLARDTRPTLAFFDFDPKGLSMAASLQRRESLCLPELDVLIDAVRKNKRTHLFTNSVATSRSHLDKQVVPEVASAWKAMKAVSMGLDQEHYPRS